MEGQWWCDARFLRLNVLVKPFSFIRHSLGVQGDPPAATGEGYSPGPPLIAVQSPLIADLREGSVHPGSTRGVN